MQKIYKYLYGPVPSRRLGRSLGIDLFPYKICSLDCIFCQLGHTTKKTLSRKEYVPTDAVLTELKKWLETDAIADYITISGSGEPTLHSKFGVILDFIREHSKIPAVLLTNGTLLHLKEVREAASKANVVKTSLNAWDQISYERVNRPHCDLQFDWLIEGQRTFSEMFKGQLWTEVFLMEGINSRPEDVRKIANISKKIAPDLIHINTAVRPPSEDYVRPLTYEQMKKLAAFFEPTAEIIAEFDANHKMPLMANQATIFAMLQRRPCTAKQIADAFSVNINEVLKLLISLMQTHRIRAVRRNNSFYYVAIGNE